MTPHLSSLSQGLRVIVFLALVLPTVTLSPSCNEVVLGDVRVQALSPTLLRIEPKGPHGFEDRTTFTVVDRNFSGICLWLSDRNVTGTLLSTEHYKIWLQPNLGVYWKVFSPKGVVLYDPIDDISQANWDTPTPTKPNYLHWPSPGEKKTAYALVDHPRFFTPEWGTAPVPQGTDLEPGLWETNGFDFSNNIDGDTYVFLLGETLQAWSDSRLELLKLTGPVPLLPDYAYGTWFTNWHNYSMQEAVGAVNRWAEEGLPLDVWGLDINWRNCSSINNELKSTTVDFSDGSDWFYDRPNTVLFPNYSSWFAFLKEQGLRTYFNDHPYPVAARRAGGLQTSPEEIRFRWEGLTSWMKKGLNFWWYDRNWRFSIPPPQVNSWRTGVDWIGLDNAAWGTYVYYKIAEEFRRMNPDGDRPITLTKAMIFDWRTGMDSRGFQEHPSHHRYPVWWTGDWVPLKASIESMVNAGVHDLKPFVHSDCGGDYHGSPGDYLRWTAHCSFGTILRYHGAGNDKPGPWMWELEPGYKELGKHITRTVRKYLSARYKLIPSLIAAGFEATRTGFPLAARGDLFWPEHPGSDASDQYIYLQDLLVAPIWDADQNETERVVWIPPGTWEDAWDGTATTGPTMLRTKRPYEQLPLWYRRDGGLLVTVDHPGIRVDAQDWSSLTLEAFPALAPQLTKRTIVERRTSERTDVHMITDGAGYLHLNISAAQGGTSRAWILRIHLMPEQHAISASVDGQAVPTLGLHIYSQGSADPNFFPLGGMGSAPAMHAGAVLELKLRTSAQPRTVSVKTLMNSNQTHSSRTLFA